MNCLCMESYVCFKCEREAMLNVKTSMAEMLLTALLKKEALTQIEQDEVKKIFVENSHSDFFLKYDHEVLARLTDILNNKEKPFVMEAPTLPSGAIKNFAPSMSREQREAKEAFDYISVIYE